MSEKIKSWRGRYVRLKSEYVVRTKVFDGYYNEDDEWIEDRSLPMVEEVEINCPLCSFIDDPDEIFGVEAEIYGVDLHKYYNREFEVGSVEPTHQIILRRNSGEDYPYIWDVKYFDVLMSTKVWVKDEEFNQQCNQ
jgi:hypothetical protein